MTQTEVSINDGKLLVITPQGELLVEVITGRTSIEVESKGVLGQMVIQKLGMTRIIIDDEDDLTKEE